MKLKILVTLLILSVLISGCVTETFKPTKKLTISNIVPTDGKISTNVNNGFAWTDGETLSFPLFLTNNDSISHVYYFRLEPPSDTWFTYLYSKSIQANSTWTGYLTVQITKPDTGTYNYVLYVCEDTSNNCEAGSADIYGTLSFRIEITEL